MASSGVTAKILQKSTWSYLIVLYLLWVFLSCVYFTLASWLFLSMQSCFLSQRIRTCCVICLEDFFPSTCFALFSLCSMSHQWRLPWLPYKVSTTSLPGTFYLPSVLYPLPPFIASYLRIALLIIHTCVWSFSHFSNKSSRKEMTDQSPALEQSLIHRKPSICRINEWTSGSLVVKLVHLKL